VLREAGWVVVRVWEHEEVDQAMARIRKILENSPRLGVGETLNSQCLPHGRARRKQAS
jgi:hypothetical protein